MKDNFRINNHFVPKFYLKKWSTNGKRIFVFQTLVSNEKVPLWQSQSVRGIAYHENLYTRISGNREIDDIEHWLEREFETPAKPVLDKVSSNLSLNTNDWDKLIRFTAAQIVRTPAQLNRDMEKWRNELPGLLESTLKEVQQVLKKGKRELKSQFQSNSGIDESLLPLRVSREPSAHKGFGMLKVETVIGRGLWLFGIKHTLTNTIKILFHHKWSILHAAPGIEWITSDDPVILLNYYKDGDYNFRGGWGAVGSEILFPLSPKHILYTQVGKRENVNSNISLELSSKLLKIIAEHSHRYIFARNCEYRNVAQTSC